MKIVDLINRVLSLAGLRIHKASSVDALQSRAVARAGEIAKLTAEVAEMTNRLAQTTATVQELTAFVVQTRSENDGLTTKVQKLTASLAEAESLPHRVGPAYKELRLRVLGLRSALARTGMGRSDAKPNLVIVVTTISQIVQFKAFVSSAPIKALYDFVAVAQFPLAGTSLPEFCAANGVSLLDSECQLFGLDQELELPPPAPPRPYFAEGSSLGDLDAEERRSLKSTNELLAEVQWQYEAGQRAQRLLNFVHPRALVLFEDNAGYNTGAWVATFQFNRVPVVVLPYAIIDQGDAAEAYFNEPGYSAEHGLLNRFVMSALPRWTLPYRGKLLLRRLAVGAIASEVLGYAQPKPWVWNSSRAEVLAVESEAMRAVYLAQGVSEGQIEVTGSVSDDLLCEAIRNAPAIRERLGLDPQRCVLVCGFPPDQLNVARPDPEFGSFREIVDRWFGEFAKLQDWQVVIKPHPAMRAEDVAYLRRFDFPVTDLDTSALVPICDLFNTSVSSTIRWAIACGKPVLNYDVYRYRYQDFANEPSVLTVSDFPDFARELALLTGDKDALKQLAERAAAAAPRWGMLDGRSGQRIAELLQRLTAPSRLIPEAKYVT